MAVDEFPHSSPDALQRETQAAAGADEPSSDMKYTKQEVNYRGAGSSTTRCENCSNFRWGGGERGTGSCRIVAGRITADAVCDEFEGGAGGSGLIDLITGESTY